MLRYAAAALVVLIAFAAVLFLWHPWSASPVAPAPESADAANEAMPLPATLEEALAAQPAYASLQPTDFSAIRTTDKSSTIGFTMVEGDAPALSAESQAVLDESLAYFDQNGIPVGFILMDIGSGRGFARNIDERIYGASMFKAPYCAYLLSQQIEQGDYTLSSAVLSGTMSDSGYFSYNGRQATIEDLVDSSIIYSDNASYGALRTAFSDADLAAWLETLGANDNMAYDDWFPHCTARDAARLWSAIYAYLQSGTEGAQLLDELCASTETSFMRAALAGDDAAGTDDAMLVAEAAQGSEAVTETDVEGGMEQVAEAATEAGIEAEAAAAEGTLAVSIAEPGGLGRLVSGTASTLQQEQARAAAVTVRAKAGWFPGDTPSLSCISENGIVTVGGRDYLLCVMTGAPYSESNALRAQDLISAVFGLRADLVTIASPDAPAAESEAAA